MWAQHRTLLVCGDRLGCAGGSGSVGDAAAACSALVFFLGAAFFAAGAFRLGAIGPSELLTHCEDEQKVAICRLFAR